MNFFQISNRFFGRMVYYFIVKNTIFSLKAAAL